jgi:hypothetical protein
MVGAFFHGLTEAGAEWLETELGEPDAMDSGWFVEDEFIDKLVELATDESLQVEKVTNNRHF